ncbi:ATP-binding protein, partial [Streptomyces synnematoformans]|uniref:ATP-binding protein n=1 Tax=Streptomyces synnematoformans TaxID=415721 RepID=UPI003CD09AEF
MLVGRSAELRALGAALERAGAGAPQAVLVGGEAGVGKTRLLEQNEGYVDKIAPLPGGG